MCKQSAVAELKEEISAWLDEAWDEYRCGVQSEFLLGKIYAFTECLEILPYAEGTADEDIIELEERYGLR